LLIISTITGPVIVDIISKLMCLTAKICLILSLEAHRDVLHYEVVIHADGQTDMAKLIGAFRDYANESDTTRRKSNRRHQKKNHSSK
jgi:hypothetical protein